MLLVHNKTSEPRCGQGRGASSRARLLATVGCNFLLVTNTPSLISLIVSYFIHSPLAETLDKVTRWIFECLPDKPDLHSRLLHFTTPRNTRSLHHLLLFKSISDNHIHRTKVRLLVPRTFKMPMLWTAAAEAKVRKPHDKKKRPSPPIDHKSSQLFVCVMKVYNVKITGAKLDDIAKIMGPGKSHTSLPETYLSGRAWLTTLLV